MPSGDRATTREMEHDVHGTLCLDNFDATAAQPFFEANLLALGEDTPVLAMPWPCEPWAPFAVCPSKEPVTAFVIEDQVSCSKDSDTENKQAHATSDSDAARSSLLYITPTTERKQAQENVPGESDIKARKPRLTRKPWATDEEERFMRALKHFEPGIEKNPVTGRVSVRLGPGVAEMISMVVRSRSVAQVRSHVQKHYILLEREASRRAPAPRAVA